MEKSLEAIRLLFAEIATKHYQINHYYWGSWLKAQRQENEVNGSLHSYPMLTVEVLSAQISEKTVALDLVIVVGDKLLKDDTNLDETTNDTLQVLKDVVDIMRSDKWREFSSIAPQGSAERFINRSLDETAGWLQRITLTISSIKNLCAIPLNGYDFEAVYVSDCEGVKIYVDGVYTETVESGGEYRYNTSGDCPDGTAVLKDSAGATISSTAIPSNTSVDITAPDGTVTITDTTPNTLHTVAVKSNGTASQQISDSTVNVQKSDSTLISAVTVKAQATNSYQVSDSAISVNSTSLGNVKATDSLNITVVDSLDSSVSVTLSGGNKITIPSLPCSGVTPEGILYNRPTFRGDSTSYRTGDAGWLYAQGYYSFSGDPTNPSTIAKLGANFDTLAANNLFGNTYRFTDETGAVYTGSNQFLLDHLTGMMFVDDGIGNVVWNDAVDNALASSLGGYTDWHLPTTEEIYSTLSYATALTSYMVTTGATGVFTSTTRPISTTQAYIFIPTTVADNFGSTNKTNTRNAIYCRAFFWDDSF